MHLVFSGLNYLWRKEEADGSSILRPWWHVSLPSIYISILSQHCLGGRFLEEKNKKGKESPPSKELRDRGRLLRSRVIYIEVSAKTNSDLIVCIYSQLDCKTAQLLPLIIILNHRQLFPSRRFSRGKGNGVPSPSHLEPCTEPQLAVCQVDAATAPVQQ